MQNISSSISTHIRNYYIKTRHIDFIRILSNQSYQKKMNMSILERDKHIRKIWDDHLSLSTYTSIMDGKRVVNKTYQFHNI